MWQLLLVLYFIFGATSSLLRRVLATKLGDHNRLINAVFFVFFLLPAAIILSFFFPHNLNVGVVNLILLFGGSIIWPIDFYLAFHANKAVDAGIFMIFRNVSPIFTLLVALPFLHEHLSVLQLFGVGLLIVSGVLATPSQRGDHNRIRVNNIVLCILSAAVLGLAVAYERYMLNRIDFGAYLIYGWGSQIIWSVILTGKEFKKLSKIFSYDAKTTHTLLIWGAANVLMAISFILALKISNSASIISSASDFMSVVVVISAYFYLKERDHLAAKSLATIVGVVGLLLIA